MLEAKLVVVGGETKTQEIALKQFPALLGRSREAAVKLPHPLVSRQHCEIFESDGKLFVRDLGSLNGTYVGSERVQSPMSLEPGSLLTIGTVTFRAVYAPNGVANGSPSVVPATFPRSDQIAPVVTSHAGPLASDWAETQPAPVVQPNTPPRNTEGSQPSRPAAAFHGQHASGESDAQPPLPNHDTDPSLLDFDHTVLSELGSHKAAPVLSSVAIEGSGFGGPGSVSLSAIQGLPQPASALSFTGGLQTDLPGTAEPVVESRILIETGESQPGTPSSAAPKR